MPNQINEDKFSYDKGDVQVIHKGKGKTIGEILAERKAQREAQEKKEEEENEELE